MPETWKWIGGLVGLYSFWLLSVGVYWQLQFQVLPAASGARTHKAEISSLLNAPTKFFSVTSYGYILNRFSLDCYQYETDLAYSIWWTLESAIAVVSQFIVICLATPYAVLVIIGGLVGYEALRRFYIKTSSQLRKLLSASQSPLFTACEELLEGLTTIRAFNQETYLAMKATKRITDSTKPYLTLQTAQVWYMMNLGFLSLFFSMILLPVAIVQRGSANLGGIAVAVVQLIILPSKDIFGGYWMPCDL